MLKSTAFAERRLPDETSREVEVNGRTDGGTESQTGLSEGAEREVMRETGEAPTPVSVVITNYNGAEVLPPTITSVEAAIGEDDEIIVVDDGSVDGSPEWVERRHPEADVVRMGRNTGRLNVVRNRGLREASNRYVFLMDNDIVIRERCLESLMGVMEAHTDVFCCTPRLVYRRNPRRIYSDGEDVHFLCISSDSARGALVSERSRSGPRPTIGCGIMLLDRKVVAALGGFDEGYMRGWGDDGELHLRGRISGYRAVQVPQAVCEHEERPHGSDRVEAQIFNRYRTLATAYSGRTLLLLAPPLLLFEIGLTVLSLLKGFFTTRVDAARRAFRRRHELLRKRAEVQSARRVSDAELLGGGRVAPPGMLDFGGGGAILIDAVSRLLDAYWGAVRRWL